MKSNVSTVERAFNECHEQIYAQALRAIKNVHDAEDIRSDVYKKIQRLKCAEYNEHHEKQAQFTTWISTITNSVILDFFRTNHQDHYTAVSDFADGENEEKSYFSFIAPEQSRADAKVLNGELREKLEKVFYELQPEQRRIASLFYRQEMGYLEISEMLDLPMGTVKATLSRARQILQKELQGVMSFCSVNVQSIEA